MAEKVSHGQGAFVDPNEEGGRSIIESSDLQAIIRDEASAPRSPDGDEDPDRVTSDLVRTDRHHSLSPSRGDREPDVTVEGDETDEGRGEPPDRLTRALETISQQQGRIDELSRHVATSRERVEPVVEMMDTPFPGIRLPKDKEHWGIRLTPEQVEQIGFDKSAAAPLEYIANAFVTFFDGMYRPMLERRVVERADERDERKSLRDSIYGSYPELRGQEDVIDVVERRIHQDLQLGNESVRARYRGKFGEEYIDTLGKDVRRFMARVRGETLEQYERSLEEVFTERGIVPRTRSSSTRVYSTPDTKRQNVSRAQSSSGTRSYGDRIPRSRGGRTDDMDALMDGHLGG